MALSLSNDNQRFFGMDLSQWPRQWRGALELLLDAPPLRALTAPVPVRVLQPDGQASTWWWRHGVVWPADPDEAPARAAHALVLPPDAVLERTLTLPRLTQRDIAEAVALEAASISPFGAAQTVWGYAVEPPSRGADTVRVRMALTSRRHIEQHLTRALQARQTAQPADGELVAESVEVWVLPDTRSNENGNQGIPLENNAQRRPVVFQTGAQAQREALVTRGRLGRLSLLALAAVLLAAIAATPVWQERSRALQAQAALDQATKAVAPQMAQREALVKQTEALRAVAEVLNTQLAPVPVLDLLTRTLPDSASLNSLRIEGDKVVITGQGDDAAALVQALSRQPGVREVRLPSPATRSAGDSKERFTIELRLSPKTHGLAVTKEAA